VQDFSRPSGPILWTEQCRTFLTLGAYTCLATEMAKTSLFERVFVGVPDGPHNPDPRTITQYARSAARRSCSAGFGSQRSRTVCLKAEKCCTVWLETEKPCTAQLGSRKSWTVWLEAEKSRTVCKKGQCYMA